MNEERLARIEAAVARVEKAIDLIAEQKTGNPKKAACYESRSRKGRERRSAALCPDCGMTGVSALYLANEDRTGDDRASGVSSLYNATHLTEEQFDAILARTTPGKCKSCFGKHRPQKKSDIPY